MNFITPRYRDLFKSVLDNNQHRSDTAYDSILFDRELAVPALIQQYSEAPDNSQLRFICVQLMGFSDSRQTIDTLIGALEDPCASVRREACLSLEQLKAEEAVEALKTRTFDVDPDVKEIANETLSYLTKQN